MSTESIAMPCPPTGPRPGYLPTTRPGARYMRLGNLPPTETASASLPGISKKTDPRSVSARVKTAAPRPSNTPPRHTAKSRARAAFLVEERAKFDEMFPPLASVQADAEERSLPKVQADLTAAHLQNPGSKQPENTAPDTESCINPTKPISPSYSEVNCASSTGTDSYCAQRFPERVRSYSDAVQQIYSQRLPAITHQNTAETVQEQSRPESAYVQQPTEEEPAVHQPTTQQPEDQEPTVQQQTVQRQQEVVERSAPAQPQSRSEKPRYLRQPCHPGAVQQRFCHVTLQQQYCSQQPIFYRGHVPVQFCPAAMVYPVQQYGCPPTVKQQRYPQEDFATLLARRKEEYARARAESEQYAKVIEQVRNMVTNHEAFLAQHPRQLAKIQLKKSVDVREAEQARYYGDVRREFAVLRAHLQDLFYNKAQLVTQLNKDEEERANLERLLKADIGKMTQNDDNIIEEKAGLLHSMLNEAFPSDDEDEESKESSEQESGELESDEEMEQESDEEPEQESDDEESEGFYVPSDSSNEQITDERREDYSQQTHDENMETANECSHEAECDCAIPPSCDDPTTCDICVPAANECSHETECDCTVPPPEDDPTTCDACAPAANECSHKDECDSTVPPPSSDDSANCDACVAAALGLDPETTQEAEPHSCTVSEKSRGELVRELNNLAIAMEEEILESVEKFGRLLRLETAHNGTDHGDMLDMVDSLFAMIEAEHEVTVGYKEPDSEPNRNELENEDVVRETELVATGDAADLSEEEREEDSGPILPAFTSTSINTSSADSKATFETLRSVSSLQQDEESGEEDVFEPDEADNATPVENAKGSENEKDECQTAAGKVTGVENPKKGKKQVSFVEDEGIKQGRNMTFYAKMGVGDLAELVSSALASDLMPYASDENAASDKKDSSDTASGPSIIGVKYVSVMTKEKDKTSLRPLFAGNKDAKTRTLSFIITGEILLSSKTTASDGGLSEAMVDTDHNVKTSEEVKLETEVEDQTNATSNDDQDDPFCVPEIIVTNSSDHTYAPYPSNGEQTTRVDVLQGLNTATKTCEATCQCPSSTSECCTRTVLQQENEGPANSESPGSFMDTPSATCGAACQCPPNTAECCTQTERETLKETVPPQWETESNSVVATSGGVCMCSTTADDQCCAQVGGPATADSRGTETTTNGTGCAVYDADKNRALLECNGLRLEFDIAALCSSMLQLHLNPGQLPIETAATEPIILNRTAVISATTSGGDQSSTQETSTATVVGSDVGATSSEEQKVEHVPPPYTYRLITPSMLSTTPELRREMNVEHVFKQSTSIYNPENCDSACSPTASLNTETETAKKVANKTADEPSAMAGVADVATTETAIEPSAKADVPAPNAAIEPSTMANAAADGPSAMADVATHNTASDPCVMSDTTQTMKESETGKQISMMNTAQVNTETAIVPFDSQIITLKILSTAADPATPQNVTLIKREDGGKDEASVELNTERALVPFDSQIVTLKAFNNEGKLVATYDTVSAESEVETELPSAPDGGNERTTLDPQSDTTTTTHEETPDESDVTASTAIEIETGVETEPPNAPDGDEGTAIATEETVQKSDTDLEHKTASELERELKNAPDDDDGDYCMALAADGPVEKDPSTPADLETELKNAPDDDDSDYCIALAAEQQALLTNAMETKCTAEENISPTQAVEEQTPTQTEGAGKAKDTATSASHTDVTSFLSRLYKSLTSFRIIDLEKEANPPDKRSPDEKLGLRQTKSKPISVPVQLPRKLLLPRRSMARSIREAQTNTGNHGPMKAMSGTRQQKNPPQSSSSNQNKAIEQSASGVKSSKNRSKSSLITADITQLYSSSQPAQKLKSTSQLDSIQASLKKSNNHTNNHPASVKSSAANAEAERLKKLKSLPDRFREAGDELDKMAQMKKVQSEKSSALPKL